MHGNKKTEEQLLKEQGTSAQTANTASSTT